VSIVTITRAPGLSVSIHWHNIPFHLIVEMIARAWKETCG
jgi:hypothetical protein